MKLSRNSRCGDGKRAWCIVAGLLLLALPAISCSFLPQRVDRAATATAEAIFVEERLGRTLEVERRVTAAAQTEQSAHVTQTARVHEQFTATAGARQTRQAAQTAQAAATATVQKQITSTAQAATFLPLVEDLVKRGYLPSAEGRYYRPDSYEQNLASKSGVIVRRMGYSAQTFLARADVEYEIASRNGNWFVTGCGFAYWDNGQNNYYLVFPALDGFTYGRAYVDGRQFRLDQSFYGVPPRPTGKYTATIVAGPKGSYLWLGERLVKHTPVIDRSMTEGALSFLIASGTDQDFGTRCRFTNVELWVVE